MAIGNVAFEPGVTLTERVVTMEFDAALITQMYADAKSVVPATYSFVPSGERMSE
jgi:hypothetical protein